MSNAYDAIIVGTGQAGAPLAGRLSEAGMKVAIIERKLFGGTCVNTGCTPTKTLVASAYAAHLARRAADFGVVINGQAGVDMKKVKARKDAVSGQSQKKCRVVAKAVAELYGLPRPRPFHISHRDECRNNAADGAAHIHQCRGARSKASNARA
jgi:pyruvate/2-oxoglutarate dehydrogenase complex dihydrolipoamide dehydrogenase (E3) component